MSEIYLHYLNHLDVQALAMTDAEIVAAVEAGLLAQGRGETTIEPRMHLVPEKDYPGHFNVLRGYVRPLGVAGVKVVGDFYRNYEQGLPSELALLNLFDPKNGVPVAIIDASDITDMRTGAVTAIGAKHLARKDSKILGHIGARGTSYWNVRLLHSIFHFDEIRVHSRRPESREKFAARLERDLGTKITVTEDWESCVRGADIVVEASRLEKPTPMLKTEWIKKGACVIPYGTMSAVELSLTDIMDKMVMDDWGQAKAGPLGALRAHVDSGKLSEQTLHAELGQIVAGLKPGRESEDETNLFWHRGLSLSDIALGSAMLEKARRMGLGQQLRFR
ncbi:MULTISPECIES: ornithine cyclodeaminase family protein [unclassified Variovorax]|jgi:ornithine cyclodeaminase|uniref:ornithine cyclodeaminase family protein n=1 Tax=unclassified Variovorax TaxID=663243 RepID=UPI00076D7BCA|nr:MULTISPECIES: ornithine cyclodeaminase family protein [unclassified Variovorax]KWT64039.1 Ornithine cyclodeaminase [Variovorax sp. WDL1]PNG58985.1 Delta(1)-pyrroline-2-carboxylate reductase [Variovorax sp. B4]PNG61225.1 Delta(1)-pyrroline-2-carboxylate reductase [Variovorax sp. B2]VTV12800.1 alanine dehydrogenase [Variovorax sp. WDL1]